MNKLGFVCFLVVLAFSSLSISLSKQNRVLDELSEAIATAIEAEKVNLVRTLLEENTDFIVSETLERAAISCNAKPGKVKQQINKTLLAYFNEMENCCNALSIEFYSNTGKRLNLGSMNRNSSLIVKKIGSSCTMEYSFHGGIMRQEFVLANIRGKAISQEFRIPVGYSQKVVVTQ